MYIPSSFSHHIHEIFYTGLPNFITLAAVFSLVESHISTTHLSSLSTFQQFMVNLLGIRLRPHLHGSGSLLIRYKICCRSASRLYEFQVIRFTFAPLSASILILLRKRTSFVSDHFCIGSLLHRVV